MKNVLVLFFILFNTGLVFTQECSPTFKEIFDFQVGDYFKYVNNPRAPGYSDIITESYTITGRKENGDTLYYTRKGTIQKTLICFAGGYSTVDTISVINQTNAIDDTLIYVDSMNHFLNQCSGKMYDVAELNEYCYRSVPSGYFTSVQITQKESMLQKTVGGGNNFFKLDTIDHTYDTLSTFLDWAFKTYERGFFEESYAKGLGLIKHRHTGIEEGLVDNNLIEYIKTKPKAEITNGKSIVICSGTRLILRANHSYTYTYQWIKDGVAIPGATCDSLEINSAGHYQVVEKNVCNGIDTSNVFLAEVNQLSISNSGNVGSIVCGGTYTLYPIISYVGDNVITYKWDTDPTLSSTNIKNPIASPITDHTYHLLITDGVCMANVIFNLTVNPLVINAGSDKSIVCGGNVQLDNPITNYSGTSPLTYVWSPADGLDATNIAQPIVEITNNKTFTLTISTTNGCIATDNVNLSISPTAFIPSICMVTVNENDDNVIVWNKDFDAAIDSFYIYRESLTQTNHYNLIGKRSFIESGVFIDTASNAHVQSDKYKIALKDVCGFYSDKSSEHKSMHLIVNKGTGNDWNLIWEEYIGMPVSSYQIFRGTTKSNLVQIGSSSGSSTIFTDENALAGDNYYQVAIPLPQGCSGLIPTDYDYSHSNIVGITNVVTNINSNSALDIFIYPNPSFDKLFIKNLHSPNAVIEIYDLQGNQALSKQITSNQIDVSNLSRGIYIIKLIDSKNKLIDIRKIIPE